MKVKVIENIGTESITCFGAPGTIHEITSTNSFTDATGYEWISLSRHFKSVAGVNNYFEKWTSYQTIFELVE